MWFVIIAEMRTVRVDDIVEFHMEDSHLYGVVEKKLIDEEGEVFLYIRVKNHLYRNVPLNAIIHDFGSEE